MSGNSKKNLFFNASLFYINGAPMKFYLEGYNEELFHEYSKIIEAHGGKLSRPEPGTIIFSEPGRYVDTDRRKFHIQCLRDSIVKNKLQDINKYALPWKINQPRKEPSFPRNSVSPENPRIFEDLIPEKPMKSVDSFTSQPHVLIQDCSMTHPQFMREKEKEKKEVPAREQSNFVSSSRDGANISLTEANSTRKVSPVTPDTKNSLKKLPKLSIPRVEGSRKKGESRRNNLRSSCRENDHVPEIIAEVPKKPLVIAEITLTSDDEDEDSGHAGPPKLKENFGDELKKALMKAKMDLEESDLEAPKLYAVWSSAGPPGPPVSDSEDEAVDDKAKIAELVKREREEDFGMEEDKRKELRSMKYVDWDSCSSEDSQKKKGKRRGRKRRSGYEYDPSFKTAK